MGNRASSGSEAAEPTYHVVHVTSHPRRDAAVEHSARQPSVSRQQPQLSPAAASSTPRAVKPVSRLSLQDTGSTDSSDSESGSATRHKIQPIAVTGSSTPRAAVTPRIACQGCNTRDAVLRCGECCEVFCAACDQVVHGRKLLRPHQRISIGAAQTTGVAERTQQSLAPTPRALIVAGTSPAQGTASARHAVGRQTAMPSSLHGSGFQASPVVSGRVTEASSKRHTLPTSPTGRQAVPRALTLALPSQSIPQSTASAPTTPTMSAGSKAALNNSLHSVNGRLSVRASPQQSPRVADAAALGLHSIRDDQLVQLTRKQLLDLWYQYDCNRDGELQLNEIQKLADDCIQRTIKLYSHQLQQQCPGITAQQLQQRVDKELHYILPSRPGNGGDNDTSNNVARLIMRELDHNRDGSISREEFLTFWPKVATRLFDVQQQQRRMDGDALQCAIS